MKPNFALRLTHESVELLHRGPAGWASVGKTAFDVPDLDAAMAALRAKAADLAPEGVFSKLILPAGEIRFDRVSAPGPTDEARRLQIEAEIEGLTPYTLSELAYDYVIEGDLALVALCAREILSEAESFALKHRFAPLSFVAQPAPGAFTGEPFFGRTSAAPELLPRGETLERDAEPVRLAGAGTQPPRPAAASASQPARPIAPSAPAVPTATPDALSRVGELVRRMGTRIRREQAATPDTTPPRPAAAAPVAKPPAAPVRPAVPGPARPAPVSMPPRSPAAAPAAARFRPVAAPVGAAAARATPDPVAADEAAPQQEPTVAAAPATMPAENPAAAKPAETAPAPAAPVAFASRRSPAPAATAPQERGARPVLASSGPGAVRPARSPGGRLAILPEGQRDAAGPGLATRLARRARRLGRQALARVGLAEARPGKARRVAEREARKTLPEPIVPASKPPASEREKASEAEALTIFGARPGQKIETGFARRGLMLAGGLILLLVAVAIWAVYFTASPQREPEVAALTPEVAPVTPLSPIAAPQSLGAPVETVPESAPEAASESALAAEPGAPAADPVAAAPDPESMLETLVQEALREALPAEALEQALDRSEALAAVSPPGADTVAQAESPAPPAATEPAIETVAEPAPAQRLAIPPPLERPSQSEVALASLAPPPPFGAEFNLGADGLVEATPEGALTPSGVMVYARPPGEVPPRRQIESAPAPAPAPVAAPVAEPAAAPETARDAAPAQPETVFDDTPRADPALAGFRPEPRSPRVAEIGARSAPAPESPAANPEDDSSSLDTPAPGGVSLAALRPQARPSDLVEAAPAQPATPETAPEAVASSLRPSARPDALSARVQEALAAARAPAPAAQTAPAASAPAPAATAAPAQPNIPTSASVAQQATQTRAINLRRINLIGVFGTPADRRALVRLSDGRVVRVQVGDRLDGGQVSAIGDNELRYVRNGRNEILRIGESG